MKPPSGPLVQQQFDRLLFIIRHGESPQNAGEKTGDWDKLTSKGVRQAAAVADVASNYGIEKIVTSTAERARQTAEVISQKTGLIPKETALLVEHENVTKENFALIKERALNAQKAILETVHKKIAVVSHGRFSRSLVLSFFKQEKLEISDIHECLMGMENTGITILGHLAQHSDPKKGWVLLRWNEVSHLSSELRSEVFCQ